MKIFEGPILPTPFGGTIKAPDLETPPLALPAMPDSRGKKAIAHGLGEDLAEVVALIPWVGSLISDSLEDMHYAEEVKLLNPDELKKYMEYNKMFPSSIAMIRTLCFKEVQALPASKALPASPMKGPPLPQALGIKWPWVKEV